MVLQYLRCCEFSPPPKDSAFVGSAVGVLNEHRRDDDTDGVLYCMMAPLLFVSFLGTYSIMSGRGGVIAYHHTYVPTYVNMDEGKNNKGFAIVRKAVQYQFIIRNKLVSASRFELFVVCNNITPRQKNQTFSS